VRVTVECRHSSRIPRIGPGAVSYEVSRFPMGGFQQPQACGCRARLPPHSPFWLGETLSIWSSRLTALRRAWSEKPPLPFCVKLCAAPARYELPLVRIIGSVPMIGGA